eukprot:6177487-Pleurochrysis_carterae.AAC.1
MMRKVRDNGEVEESRGQCLQANSAPRLEGHVLEGERRAVVELEHVQTIDQRLNWRHLWIRARTRCETCAQPPSPRGLQAFYCLTNVEAGG